ncbi:CmpA/NrtA family ABC transporter substrate-binding protein [Pseudomonas sp. N040]|uniref:CmpA/NrtA family ABC transporter substrate-binding protein n=1 Tax=Pseudomonas sp. N040 TaxID=2785325 RepID=UPI0018A30EE1|nr:CmpA/NrtA family ABC transporter substrate-binding protein [Pseudomonas sp. N040]MBF7729614.1 ABC transporter substrate-binding protein [Pseudomonas sp. N040]MBW7013254.1 ABC transporter substrate-binding protein [Pseudomonas sp. N040]
MSEQYQPPHSNSLDWVGGSDAPEKRSLNLGFMALTDSASLIVAATQQFAQPYGLTLKLQRQSSWAGLRERLHTGELDAAQSLYGLVYGMHLGLGGAAPLPMAVLMGLAQNGQSINLSARLQSAGVRDGEALARYVRQAGARLTFAHTFPTGTHAMWLYYWLASLGIHPLRDVDSVVVPPAQMVAHLRAGRIDGFCAGEPWGAQAVAQGQGFTVCTSQSLWADHPEKVLGCTREFVETCPNAARALVMAVLEASRFLDANVENRSAAASLVSAPEFLDTPLEVIEPRFCGRYEDGNGQAWLDPHPLRFCAQGAVNMPYLSDGMWFLTQFRRWGLLREEPDYLALAGAVQQTALYAEAASSLGLAVPPALRSSRLFDGKLWDGSDPAAYARSFELHALTDARQAGAC